MKGVERVNLFCVRIWKVCVFMFEKKGVEDKGWEEREGEMGCIDGKK